MEEELSNIIFEIEKLAKACSKFLEDEEDYYDISQFEEGVVKSYFKLRKLRRCSKHAAVWDHLPVGRRHISRSLGPTLSWLQFLLIYYSSKFDEEGDHVERQIRMSNISRKGFHGLMFACKSLSMFLRDTSSLKGLLMVRKEIDSLFQELISIKENHRGEDLQLNCESGASDKKEYVPKHTMVVLDEDLIKLKDHLCGGSSQLRIISIVGTGGIGKTTLARNVFDDSLVTYRFDFLVWVTVSQDYNVRKILLSLMKSLKIVLDEKVKNEAIKEHVYKYLKGRRYLVVTDDVWSTKVWDDIKKIFPNDSNGSRILLTTRLTNVADYASSVGFVHQMHFLNEEGSWNLLQGKVFGQEHCPRHLIDIGKSIASKCGGLPLAIVMIAGLLSNTMISCDWRKIEGKVVPLVSRHDDKFSRTMSLSYSNLPHHLKTCFLYLGIFPEDYEIPVSKLIKLWVAEGFIKSFGSKCLEQVAEEYLDDLAKRNLVIVLKRRVNGQIKSCIIHDLLRDFCRQRAHRKKLWHFVGKHGYRSHRSAGDIYRRDLPSNFVGVIKKIKRNGRHAHSLLNFSKKNFLVEPQWCGFKELRVLDAPEMKCCIFPQTILDMIHLKYLSLSLHGIGRTSSHLPRQIYKLQNLETLILHVSRQVEIVIPMEIWKMSRLRHLIISGSEVSLPSPSVPEVGDMLPDLQTLSGVINFKFTNEAVAMIPNLKKLKIALVDQDQGTWKSYDIGNLIFLHQLVELNIITCSSISNVCPSDFVFPPNLRKLSLHGCEIDQEILKGVGSLPNLQVLKLTDISVVGEVWEVAEGEFPSLKFLLMYGLNLKCWQVESSNFPCLEHLHIIFCWQLEEIPADIGDLSSLNFIDLEGCSSAVEDSAKQILSDQQYLGNDVLQVRFFVTPLEIQDSRMPDSLHLGSRPHCIARLLHHHPRIEYLAAATPFGAKVAGVLVGAIEGTDIRSRSLLQRCHIW